MSPLRGIHCNRGLAAKYQREADRIMTEALELAAKAYTAKREAERAVVQERERCARLCEQFPDNLMAKYLREKIRRG